MARRIDNECAYCAEVIKTGKAVVGKDWKVYCCSSCAEAGEQMSTNEFNQLMRHSLQSRVRFRKGPSQPK